MRPSPAPARSSRTAGAAGALLLQGGFVLLFLYSMPQFSHPIEVGREMIFVLHRPPPPAPVLPKPESAPPPPGALPLPGPAPPMLAPVLPQIPALNAPALPDWKGFGEALNDCAPEKYANLPPEQKAHCPKPGAGVAIQELPKLLGPLPQAKDEASWQEDWDEKHWTAGLCDPSMGSVVQCQIQQAIAESERAADVNSHLARDKAAALKPPSPPIPPAPKGGSASKPGN